MATFEIKWQAPEFEYRQKGALWYWASIGVAVVVIGLSVWQKNFLFGFFVVIAEVLLLVWAEKKPIMREFILNEKGLSIGHDKSYAFAEMESFSVDGFAETEWPSIFFQFHRRLKPALKIKAPKSQLEEIQKMLQASIGQVEYEHSTLDTLEELIRF